MLKKSDLINYFQSSFTDPLYKGIGTEHEKFIFNCGNKKRIEFDGDISIQDLFKFLLNKGWQKGEYNSFNQLISLTKNGANVTLEPGCQLELSGKVFKNVHQTCTESYEHLNELKEYAELKGLCILGLGFDPLSKLDEIKFIPKDRYNIMKNYMPKVGTRGLDMMTRTCTVQANFDYFDDQDLIKKFVVANRIQPKSAPYLDTLGWIYFKLEQYDKALEYIQASYSIDNTNAVIVEHLADILKATDQISKANLIYMEAIDIGGDSLMIHQKMKIE